MNDSAQSAWFPYLTNKFVSLGLTLTLFYFISLLSNNAKEWSLLTLFILIFGQGHFITSYIYHFSSLKKKFSLKLNLFLLFVLASSSFFFYIAWVLRYDTFILFFTSAYFIIHNTLNERSMWDGYFKKHESGYAFIAMALCLFLALYASTLEHPSFAYLLDRGLILFDNLDYAVTERTIFSDTTALVTWLCFLSIIPLTIFCFKGNLGGKIAGLIFFGFMLLLLLSEIITDYLYFFAFVIIYHYITWFIYYFHRLDNKHSSPWLYRRNNYALLSFFTYVSLVLIAIFANTFQSKASLFLYTLLFDAHFFMFWTFLHISITLLNETFIKKILHL